MNLRTLFLAAAAASPLPSAAQSIITVTSDSGASNVMDACVLRDAITYANSGVPTGGCGAATTIAAGSHASAPNYNPGNVIELPPQSTITLTAVDDLDRLVGLPVVSSPLIVYGNGSTIRRDTTFDCVIDGQQTPGEIGLFYNDSNLELHSLTLEGGCADASLGGNGKGGAIYNAGQLLLEAVTLRGNQAYFDGGGLHSAGYVAGAGKVVMSRVLIDANSARIGGGVYLEGGTASMVARDVAFVDNSADQYFAGGGLMASVGTQAELVNATFARNAAGSGSALQADGVVTLSFTTIAESDTLSGSGAALQVSPNGPLQVLTVRNTLLAGNVGGVGNCQFHTGNVVDAVANLSSDASCNGFALQDVAVTIGAFVDSGGYASTYPLLPASPAVDAVTACTDTHDDPVTTDQRGAARPQGAACDIGAFELPDRVFENGFEIIAN